MEEPKFFNGEIFYNLAFDLGGNINPIDAARNLLKVDFVGGFVNYTTGDQEIAECYQEQTENYRTYVQASQFGDEYSFRKILKLIRSNPSRWGPAFARGFVSAPFTKKDGEDESDVDIDDSNEELDTDGVEQAVADFVLTILGQVLIYASVDETTFHEDYLKKAPFTRISIQPFTVIVDHQRISYDVVLTIHKTGIAVLTCHGSLPNNLSAREIIELRHPSLLHIDACEVPAKVISRYYLDFAQKLKDSMR